MLPDEQPVRYDDDDPDAYDDDNEGGEDDHCSIDDLEDPELRDIVRAVVATLRETDVWKFIEQMMQEERGRDQTQDFLEDDDIPDEAPEDIQPLLANEPEPPHGVTVPQKPTGAPDWQALGADPAKFRGEPGPWEPLGVKYQ
jgi:hypothetical protein